MTAAGKIRAAVSAFDWRLIWLVILSILLTIPGAFATPSQDCSRAPPDLQRLCLDINQGAQPSSKAIKYLHERVR